MYNFLVKFKRGGRFMEDRFLEKVLDNRNVIVDLWLREIVPIKDENYPTTISHELIDEINREFVEVIFSSIQHQHDVENIEQFTEKLINLGWPLSFIVDGLQTFRRVTINYILTEFKQIDTDYFSSILEYADNWLEPIIRQLVNEYTISWEETVSLQRIALKELSAPLIPVMERISVMPLIGAIDTERARLIMENLLKGVTQHNAEVVLLDITGVPIVDTMVAHHIIKAAEAVRLIGATCILVGIRPEIAQTIVNLGINLSNFPTKSSLKKGFAEALSITNRQVIELKEEQENIEKLLDSLQKE